MRRPFSPKTSWVWVARMMIWRVTVEDLKYGNWTRERYLSAGVGDTDVAARVTFLGEFAGEKFVELGAENTVGDKLALFADLGGHFVVWRSVERRKRTRFDWNIYLEDAVPRWIG